MNDHKLIIEKFYAAFADKDWKTMHDCYHQDVTFSDPAFPDLKGKKAKAMWHMLLNASTDLKISHNNIKADKAGKGSCHWEATYSFSRTGRKVHNKIDAKFTFKDNLIISHKDTFDLWRWSRMALGLPGTLLGWTSFMKGKIQKMANSGLLKFINEHPEYQ